MVFVKFMTRLFWLFKILSKNDTIRSLFASCLRLTTNQIIIRIFALSDYKGFSLSMPEHLKKNIIERSLAEKKFVTC
jgi:hypothetical protein